MIRRLKARWFLFLGHRLRSRRVALTLEYFQRAAALQPDIVSITVQIAWCFQILHNYAAAVDACDQVLRKYPRWGEIRAQRALALAGLGRCQDALDELARAQRMGFNKTGKDLAFWEGRRGACLSSLGRHDEAIEPLKLAVSLTPKSAWTRYELGCAYAQTNHPEEAVKELQEAARLAPARMRAEDHAYLGWLFLSLKQFDKAAAAYLEALKLQPDDAPNHYALAFVYGEMGRVDDEISEYNKSLAIVPDDLENLNNLANAYSKSGRSESAIETRKRAIRCDPTRIDVRTSLAGEYHRMERYQEGLDVCREIERLDPSSAVAHANVAGFLNRLGNFREAVEKAKESMSLDPNCPDGYLHAGMALQELGDHEAALRELRKADELKADDYCVLGNLGYGLLELGRSAEAMAFFKRAIELEPGSVEIHDNLGVAYFKLGDRTKAVEQLAIVDLLKPGFDSNVRKLLV